MAPAVTPQLSIGASWPSVSLGPSWPSVIGEVRKEGPCEHSPICPEPPQISDANAFTV